MGRAVLWAGLGNRREGSFNKCFTPGICSAQALTVPYWLLVVHSKTHDRLRRVFACLIRLLNSPARAVLWKAIRERRKADGAIPGGSCRTRRATLDLHWPNRTRRAERQLIASKALGTTISELTRHIQSVAAALITNVIAGIEMCSVSVACSRNACLPRGLSQTPKWRRGRRRIIRTLQNFRMIVDVFTNPRLQVMRKDRTNPRMVSAVCRTVYQSFSS